MAKITDQMYGDIEKETVSYSPNYDGSEFIPDVLPTKIPNLLVNGSSGIAVGMATNIPPHNLTEVLNASINLINNPKLSIDDLIKDISGPDFPTGGTKGLIICRGLKSPDLSHHFSASSENF